MSVLRSVGSRAGLQCCRSRERAQAVSEAEGFVIERSRPASEAGCGEGTAYVMGVMKA